MAGGRNESVSYTKRRNEAKSENNAFFLEISRSFLVFPVEFHERDGGASSSEARRSVSNCAYDTRVRIN